MSLKFNDIKYGLLMKDISFGIMTHMVKTKSKNSLKDNETNQFTM